MSDRFPPTPQILQWLAAGQLANRFMRSIRLWVLLNKLYANNWAESLPQPFTYSQLRDSQKQTLRDRLFSHHHPKSEKLSADEISSSCGDTNCLCHQKSSDIIFAGNFQLDKQQWQLEISQMTGFCDREIQQLLYQCPFATVHRTLRDDLKQLVSLGWLQLLAKGKYQCLAREHLPVPLNQTILPEKAQPKTDFRLSELELSHSNLSHLNLSQTWELLRVLESIAFVQPNLSIIINNLWEQIGDRSPTSLLLENEPQQRIFLHLDYIISSSMQDRVDTYQEQLESLWHKPPGGVVQLDYWVAATEHQVQVTVYPVCLHYLRRAKYLSAYGIDPNGNLAWHNYRLDRIASERLKVLAWGDPSVPKTLKDMWHAGELPTPEYISKELETAWGFNFYLPKQLLILRFPPHFAKWYVDNTFRHQTFRAVPHQQLAKIATKDIVSKKERQHVLEIIKKRSSEDIYYTAWVRTGDINVLMRLRDWRPNGEVIAPISIREQLALEAARELANYDD